MSTSTDAPAGTASTADHFRHNRDAEANRAAKAKALAAYAWDRDLAAVDLAAMTTARRSAFARAAGVNPPSGTTTWEAVDRLLERKAGWARTNPDHPASARAAVDERGEWVAAVAPDAVPEPPVVFEDDLDAVVLGPAAPFAPRGWDALSELPLLPALCSVCRRPALVGTGDRYRCPDHPPQPGEWGATMNWTPHPHRTCLPERCLCGRCPSWRPF